MVATSGATWRLAPSLDAFIDECDRRWPDRPTESDGSIGDAGHSARVSDHNPDDDETDRDQTRWVCAVDLTDATPDQPQPWHILDGIRARRDPRCKYGISEGLAFYSYAKPGRPAWTWVKYDGPNGHFSHGHLSIHNTAAARDDTASWLTGPPAPPLEEDMPGPAIVRDSKGRRILFDKGPDDALWWQVDAKPWGPTSLTDRLGSAPCAVLTGNGVVEIAAYGGDGKTSFVCTWNGAVFSPWVPTGAKG